MILTLLHMVLEVRLNDLALTFHVLVPNIEAKITLFALYARSTSIVSSWSIYLSQK